jgi:hypothetical protein
VTKDFIARWNIERKVLSHGNGSRPDDATNLGRISPCGVTRVDVATVEASSIGLTLSIWSATRLVAHYRFYTSEFLCGNLTLSVHFFKIPDQFRGVQTVVRGTIAKLSQQPDSKTR